MFWFLFLSNSYKMAEKHKRVMWGLNHNIDIIRKKGETATSVALNYSMEEQLWITLNAMLRK